MTRHRIIPCDGRRSSMMSSWKRFIAEVDAHAHSLLKNKKFSREERKFTWDWHAWNLALVTAPSLFVGIYLHGVEKRMIEEAKIREEIEERTGVSSRGFLVPPKNVRQEVQGMLSKGSQSDKRKDLKELERSDSDKKGETPAALLIELQNLRRKLDDMESMISSEHVRSSADEVVENVEGRISSRSSSGPRYEASATESGNSFFAGADKVLETVLDKAKAMTSTASAWVWREGQTQAGRLVKAGQDWIAGRGKNREENATQSEACGNGSDNADGIDGKGERVSSVRGNSPEEPSKDARHQDNLGNDTKRI